MAVFVTVWEDFSGNLRVCRPTLLVRPAYCYYLLAEARAVTARRVVSRW